MCYCNGSGTLTIILAVSVVSTVFHLFFSFRMHDPLDSRVAACFEKEHLMFIE